MTKKKSILIVAIIAVLVVAISGVSFATWQAFIKPADQTWTVTANNPATLIINSSGAVGLTNYNGEKGTADDKYKTTYKVNVTSTDPTQIAMNVGYKVTVNKAGGDEQYVDLPAGTTFKVSSTNNILEPNVPKDVSIFFEFPDLSDATYYGAKFKIVLTLGKVA